MARFNVNEVDNYGGSGETGYFSLQNDKDVAQVRFMYRDINDVEGFAVHQIEVGDRRRYVNCLRSYDQPLDNCPFCKERMSQIAKLFIPLYDINEGKVKVWERGKKFFSKVSSLCARFSNPTVVSHIFEIERNGKKGDQTTTYEIYEIDQDNCTLEDLPDVPNVLGGIVMDKSFEDMNYYIENGDFPSDDNDSNQVRRRESNSDRNERRTPSRGRDSRRDRF